jgi:hypothetical protein
MRIFSGFLLATVVHSFEKKPLDVRFVYVKAASLLCTCRSTSSCCLHHFNLPIAFLMLSLLFSNCFFTHTSTHKRLLFTLVQIWLASLALLLFSFGLSMYKNHSAACPSDYCFALCVCPLHALYFSSFSLALRISTPQSRVFARGVLLDFSLNSASLFRTKST